MTIEHHWITSATGPDRLVETPHDTRYDLELDRVTETAERVTRDAREARDTGVITPSAFKRIERMADEYTRSMVKLLKHVYFDGRNDPPCGRPGRPGGDAA